MNLSSHFDRYDGGILMGLSATFLIICSKYYWFTIDDAYITLRYSRHLAEGHGILWNIGADPVEGYTSFLWVVIGAIPHVLNISPVNLIKVVGIVSTILSIILLYGYGRYRGINRYLALIGGAQLALNPAVAVLSVQGMETMTAMLLILVASITGFEYLRQGNTRWLVVMDITLLFSMLTRPDAVIFAVLFQIGLVSVLYRRGKNNDIKKLIGVGFLLVFIPGVLYMLARYWYFGHLFPNSFYIKSEVSTGTFGSSTRGIENTETFLKRQLGPLLLLTIGSIILGRISSNRLVSVVPAVLSVSGFLVLYLFIDPLQGYLWRFQMPIFCTAILILMLIIHESLPVSVDYPDRLTPTRKMVLMLLITCSLVLVPLTTASTATHETTIRTPGDRVVMGQALGSVQNGEDYRMFVTESGAIPYYSEWTAVDSLGLNSEHIAHEGRSVEYLKEFDPDLVQMLVSGRPGMIQDKSSETAKLLESESYVLVAAVHKQNRDKTNVQPNRYHLYFVNRESEGYRDIACTLLSQDLKYGNRSEISNYAQFDIEVSSLNRTDCQ